jgi:hypothetical protein
MASDGILPSHDTTVTINVPTKDMGWITGYRPKCLLVGLVMSTTLSDRRFYLRNHL